MLLHKKTIFFIAGFTLFLFATHQPRVLAGSDLDDFSSFFEELMSGKGENPFADMFAADEPSSKKAATSGKKQTPAVAMPTRAQRTELATLTTQLLSALNSIIKTTHPHHASWGGAVYEKTKQHRHSLTSLESLILHIQAIAGYFPAKEIEPFIAAFKKHTSAILDLVAAVNSLPVAKTVSILDENAFLMGKTTAAPSQQTTQEQKRRINGLTSLGKKTEELCAELKKLLAAPELKKIFPEPAKPTAYKPGASSRSYSPPPARSRGKKGDSSWDDGYGSNGSAYSSDYPYDDYYDYSDSSLPKSSTDTDSSDKDSASGDKTPSAAYSPKETDDKKDLPSDVFADQVKDFQEDELVCTLLRCLEGGPMTTNPDYFSTLGRTFEQLFVEHKDGGLTALAERLKHLDKELLTTEAFLKGARTAKTEQPGLPGAAPTTTEEKESAEQTKKDIATATEAREDYLQAKQGVASALLRLLYTPTEHRVREETATSKPTGPTSVRLVWLLPEHRTSEDAEPKKHLGMNISRNVLDQEDVLCRHGRETFTKFLDMLTKKCALGEYIKTQEAALHKEIDHFEDLRRRKVDTIIGTLTNTSLVAEHMTILMGAAEQLAALARDIHYERPTLNTNDVHLYQLRKHKERVKTKAPVTEEQEKELESGLGTSRYMVNITLTSLQQALQKVTPEDIPTAEVEKLARALAAAQTGWTDSITEEKPTLATQLALKKLMPAQPAETSEQEVDDTGPVTLPIAAPGKPVFQGISPDQLQKMLGTIAQPPAKRVTA